MSAISRFLAKFISKHSYPLFLAGLLFSLTSLLFTRPPEIDGALAGNLSKESYFVKVEQKIESIFHNDETIHIKVNPKDQPLKNILSGLSKLDSELKGQFKISGTNSILTFKKYYYLEEINEELSFFSQVDKLKGLPYLDHLISHDGKSLLVEVKMVKGQAFNLDAFDELLRHDFEGIKNMKALSERHIESTVAKYIQSDLVLFIVFILAICLFIIIYTFGSFTVVLYAAFMIFVSLSPIALLMNIFAIKINIITILAFPVVLILAIADMIHLLTGWQHLRNMEKVVNDYIFPSFLTSVAVMVDFLSLMNNDIQNLREFGMVVSISVMLEFFIIFLYAPYLMPKLKIKARHQNNFLSNAVGKLLSLKKEVSIILIVGFVVSLFLMPSLKFNTTMDSFLPKGSQLYKDHEEMNKDFNSLMNLKVLIEPPEYPKVNNFQWDSSDVAKVAYTLSDRIKKKTGVDSVYSINEAVNYYFKKGMTADKWETVNFSNPLNVDQNYLIFAKVQRSDDIITAYSQIQPLMKSLENRAKISFSSPVLLFYEIDQTLARQLLYSLLTSSLSIMFIFYLLTNSVRNTLFALFANIMPVSFIAILFYFCHFDLNLVTSLTSVICLGIVVDDTIHVLYRLCYKKEKDIKELGDGMITTTLILALGFGSLIFSSFEPTRIFGLVSSIVFIIAVLSDLALLSFGVIQEESTGTQEESEVIHVS